MKSLQEYEREAEIAHRRMVKSMLRFYGALTVAAVEVVIIIVELTILFRIFQ